MRPRLVLSVVAALAVPLGLGDADPVLAVTTALNFGRKRARDREP